jgi:hypothetical protein
VIARVRAEAAPVWIEDAQAEPVPQPGSPPPYLLKTE